MKIKTLINNHGRWLNGRGPMFMRHDAFIINQNHFGTLRASTSLFGELPFSGFSEMVPFRERLASYGGIMSNRKWWTLTANGSFLVMSFYSFINDGSTHCPISRWFWRRNCPQKINLFNWLVWKNKILSLENLEKRRCNKLPTATCVMCHEGVKFVDHLFLHRSFAKHVWEDFVRLFHLPEPFPPIHESNLG